MQTSPLSVLLGMMLPLCSAAGAGGAVHVDGCAPGPGDGSPANPYTTLGTAVAQAPPASTIIVQAGSYPERLVIDRALTITASGGPARVGEYHVGWQEVCVDVHVWEGTINGDPPGTCWMPPSPDRVNARVYYPSRAPGPGVSVACGGPFPAVVYAHGRRDASWALCDWSAPLVGEPHEDYLQADGLLTKLAASGIIALSVDNSWGDVDFVKRGAIVINSVAYLRDANEPGGWLAGMVDLQRVALAGHSLGGAAALFARAEYLNPPYDALNLGNVQIPALGLLAPGWFCSGFPEVPPAGVALLTVWGTREHVFQVGDRPVELYGAAHPPKHLVVVPGANHFGYTDAICLDPAEGLDNPSDVGGATGREAQARQQRAARNFLRAFFAHYLQGDAASLCYLLQNTSQTCSDPGDPGWTCEQQGEPPNCPPPQCVFSNLAASNVEVSVCSCVR